VKKKGVPSFFTPAFCRFTFALPVAFAQLGEDFAGDPAGALDLVGAEGDGADDGVAAAAVSLADRGDVVAARARAEGV
jgi:hypothetical protein